MKNTTFNIIALKKYTKKSQINYFNCADDNIIIWDSRGHFAIKTKKIIYSAELKTALPTFEQYEIPQCIKRILIDGQWETVPEIRKTNILYQFKDDTISSIFYNPNSDYITEINTDLLNIIKPVEKYTIKQIETKSPVLFTDGITNIILMPMYNKELKNNILKSIGEK
jgi:hypothetical protein